MVSARTDDPGRLDLHMHTDRSDGALPPDAVLARAAAGKLDFIAVTDHDLPNVLRAGEHTIGGHTLRVVAGVELSGSHAGREFHLLVYFPGEMPDDFREFLRVRASRRADRFDAALEHLAAVGGATAEGASAIARADAAARAGERSLTRHHLYKALRAEGAVRDMREGFRLLGGSDVVPLIDLSFVDAIRAARGSGGLTSWAHPALADARAYTRDFAAAGLQGLEGLRPGLGKGTRTGLRDLAQKFGLLVTGGSDWHGWNPGELGDFAMTGERARAFRDRLDA